MSSSQRDYMPGPAAGDEELAADARDVYPADTSDYAALIRPTKLDWLPPAAMASTAHAGH